MNRTSEQELKLWISQDFYIPVDHQGYSVGKYYEGAMGIVVEIKRSTGGSYALKIPWLMGDTVKENAYVAELLIEERNSVLSVFSDCSNTSGLMHAEVFGSAIVQKPIQTVAAPPEAQRFHNAAIAIQFRKGRAPRFCAVFAACDKKEKLRVFPPKIEDCPFSDKKVFDRACSKAKAGDTDWSNLVGVNLSRDQSLAGVVTLKDSLHQQTDENAWYLGVPAVIYVWGSTTLHEVISEGKLANWHLEKHLTMVERIVKGVDSLHKRGFLHTDIRPANIMSRGECDDPHNYYLIDYAGYNVGLTPHEPSHSSKPKPAGAGCLGPSIGGERQSPFYAPERGKGVEKEGADTAIVLDKEDHYLVLFGWRNKLLEADGKSIKEQFIAELERCGFEDSPARGAQQGFGKQQNNENDILLPGDRLQIREFIFKIEAVGSLKGLLQGAEVYRCSKHYYKIYHNRIVSTAEEPFSKHWIAIPRIIELRQWAAGTDIYGIGALLLYTLFRKQGDAITELKIIQDLTFQRLLAELANPHYLDSVWYELSRICTQLSMCHSQLRPRDDLKRILFKPDAFWEQSRLNLSTEGKSIDAYASYVTNLVIHTAPDSAKILQNLGYNYIYFLYAIYFTLCCMHRQQAMSKNLLEAEHRIPAEFGPDNRLFLPFCVSRITPPVSLQESSPIEAVQSFLSKFKKIVESGYFKDFILTNQQEEKPENLPAPLLRREIGQLKHSNSQLSDLNRNLTVERDHLQQQKLTLENTLQDVNQRLESMASFAGKMNKHLFYDSKQVKDLVAEICNLRRMFKLKN
jgi:serine/threonine protein kinase